MPASRNHQSRDASGRGGSGGGGGDSEAPSDVGVEGSSFVLPREPVAVLWLRLFTLIAIAACAAVFGGVAFTYLRQAETARFQLNFDNAVSTLEATTRMHLQDLSDATEDMAAEFVVPVAGIGSFFPGLQDRAERKLRLAKAVSAGLTVVVPTEKRAVFEAWASANAATAVSATDGNVSARAVAIARYRYRTGIVGVWGPSGGGNAISSGAAFNLTFPRSDEIFVVPDISPFFTKAYFPLLYGFPLETMASSYMVDSGNLTVRAELLRRVGATGKPGSSGFALIIEDVLQGLVRPLSTYIAPIFYTIPHGPPPPPVQPPPALLLSPPPAPPGPLEAPGGPLLPLPAPPACQTCFPPGTRIITAHLGFSFLWTDILSTLLVDLSSMEVIIYSAENNLALTADDGSLMDTTRITFRIRGANVSVVGFGDLHSEVDYLRDFRRVIPVQLGFSLFTITVYPTEEMFRAYQTRLPEQALIGCVLLIVGIAAFFGGFDHLSRKHYNASYLSSALSNAESRVERENMRSRHAFVSMVSHEIRTPASAIMGALDILHATDLSPPQRNYLDTIRIGSAQILSLVEDALAVGSEGAATGNFTLNPTVVNLRRDILERSWSSIRLQKRFAEKISSIKMSLEILGPLPELCVADSARCQQVFTNLLGNALKFVDAQTGVVTMTASFSDGLLTVIVEDNGCGLSPEGMQRLFKPFSQASEETKARYGGTGLGLVISRDISRAMGGDLIVFSPGVGLGATFIATMHLEEAATGGGGGGGEELSSSADSAYYVSCDDAAAPAAAHPPPRRDSIPGGRVVPVNPGGRAAEAPQGASSSVDTAVLGESEVVVDVSKEEGPAAATDAGLRSATGQAVTHSRRSGEVRLRPRLWGGRDDRGGASGDRSSPQPAAAARPRVRVIAAEDDELCRRVLKMTLGLAGMDCTDVVANGEILTDILGKDPFSTDLIVLDANMGGGAKDGLPTVRRLVALYATLQHPPPPIVILSGEGGQGVVDAFTAAGATRVIRKPANLAMLKTLPQLVHG